MQNTTALCPRCFRLMPLSPAGICVECAQLAHAVPSAPVAPPVSEAAKTPPAPRGTPGTSVDAIRTSHYGKPVEVYLPAERVEEPEEDASSDNVEGALQLGVVWVRRLIVISAATAILTLAILSLAKRNRASQAEAFVRAQIGLKQQERTAQLVSALAELSDLYSELKLKGRENPNTDPHKVWRAGWRQRLQQVVLEYRLDGQVDFTRTHTTAEASLRDVQLYLFSLDREWRGAVDEASPISRQLEQSLKDARNDLN